MIYLDHAATTPMLPEAKKALQEALDFSYGNASSLHTPGHLANEQIEEARARLAKLINADPSEIIFTSSSTESNNTVINIFRGQPIAVSEIEHESLLLPARDFASAFTPVKVDKNGKVCYNKDIWTKSLKLLSILHASNELGTIQDLEFWSKKAHENGAYFHSDMTQSLGKIPIDVKKLGVDYATFSAHKIGGPLGVAALYVSKTAPFEPFLIGGSQESHRRAGTYNTPAIIGFGAALEFIQKNNTASLYEKNVRPLRDYFASEILQKIPGASLNTPLENSLPNILNVSFRAAEGESIQLLLDAAGIVVSTGSACASNDLAPSHVLMATTNDAERSHSSIRFSLGLETAKSEIDEVLKILPGIIEKLQGISTI